MKRRDFIRLTGGACAIPVFSVARSQEAARSLRIGILSDNLNDRWQGGWRAFFEELAAGGFIEGTNLQVDRRGFSPTTLDTVAIELVRARPDVILTFGPPAGRAVQRATHSTPIVVTVDDLVTSGLVGSMSRPEGNLTGVAVFAFQLDIKRLELLHEAVPNEKRIGILADPDRKPESDALGRAAAIWVLRLSFLRLGPTKKSPTRLRP
jgi:putative ABC transport system substrate-binding protein